jgi:hypothetical protein
MKVHEIESAIGDGLSPAALEWWNGAILEIRDEMVILAQREDIAAAIAAVEDLAR